MTIDLDWDLSPYTQSDRIMRLASALNNCALEAVMKSMPELADDFPTKYQPICACHFDESGWFAIRLDYKPHRIFVLNAMSQEEIDFVKSKQGDYAGKTAQELEATLGPNWYGRTTFTYFGPIVEGRVSFTDMGLRVIDWLNHKPLETALSYNRARIELAIPTPPKYDLEAIFGAIWVLECDDAIIQGTAFSLDGNALITCDHCLGSATKAFRYDTPSEKYDVKIINRHHVIDLAVLEPIASPTSLKRGNPNNLVQMDHLLVVGHPNHRPGEAPIVSPGFLVGRRPRSGIQRLLTNAPIVTGGSGGPVLNAVGEVIGVAVTGSRSFGSASQTEDHSIVPIDALDLLS